MSRSGHIGTLLAIASFAVAVSLSVVFHRWAVHRIPRMGSARAKLWLAVALAAVVVMGPAARVLVNAGASDAFSWGEALAQLWSMSLMISLPVVVTIEIVAAIDRKRRLRHASAPPSPADVSRREALVALSGGTVVAGAAAALGWGLVRTRHDVEWTEIPVRVPRLPRALDGMSIVQVSDIHIGPYLGERELRRFRDMVRGAKPDLLVMTGDLVHLRPSYLPLALGWLRELHESSRWGSLSIRGNHEFYVGIAEVAAGFERAKLPMLINGSTIVAPQESGGLAVVGVDDPFGLPKHGPNFDVAMAGLDPDAPRILLCHQPQLAPYAAPKGFALQLSGHTHGGQIAPVGPIAAKVLFGPYVGRHRFGDMDLYVNRGLGTSGPPSRVAVRPEITKIVLVAG